MRITGLKPFSINLILTMGILLSISVSYAQDQDPWRQAPAYSNFDSLHEDNQALYHLLSELDSAERNFGTMNIRRRPSDAEVQEAFEKLVQFKQMADQILSAHHLRADVKAQALFFLQGHFKLFFRLLAFHHYYQPESTLPPLLSPHWRDPLKLWVPLRTLTLEMDQNRPISEPATDPQMIGQRIHLRNLFKLPHPDAFFKIQYERAADAPEHLNALENKEEEFLTAQISDGFIEGIEIPIQRNYGSEENYLFFARWYSLKLLMMRRVDLGQLLYGSEAFSEDHELYQYPKEVTQKISALEDGKERIQKDLQLSIQERAFRTELSQNLPFASLYEELYLKLKQSEEASNSYQSEAEGSQAQIDAYHKMIQSKKELDHERALILEQLRADQLVFLDEASLQVLVRVLFPQSSASEVQSFGHLIRESLQQAEVDGLPQAIEAEIKAWPSPLSQLSSTPEPEYDGNSELGWALRMILVNAKIEQMKNIVADLWIAELDGGQKISPLSERQRATFEVELEKRRYEFAMNIPSEWIQSWISKTESSPGQEQFFKEKRKEFNLNLLLTSISITRGMDFQLDKETLPFDLSLWVKTYEKILGASLPMKDILFTQLPPEINSAWSALVQRWKTAIDESIQTLDVPQDSELRGKDSRIVTSDGQGGLDLDLIQSLLRPLERPWYQVFSEPQYRFEFKSSLPSSAQTLPEGEQNFDGMMISKNAQNVKRATILALVQLGRDLGLNPSSGLKAAPATFHQWLETLQDEEKKQEWVSAYREMQLNTTLGESDGLLETRLDEEGNPISPENRFQWRHLLGLLSPEEKKLYEHLGTLPKDEEIQALYTDPQFSLSEETLKEADQVIEEAIRFQLKKNTEHFQLLGSAQTAEDLRPIIESSSHFEHAIRQTPTLKKIHQKTYRDLTQKSTAQYYWEKIFHEQVGHLVLAGIAIRIGAWALDKASGRVLVAAPAKGLISRSFLGLSQSMTLPFRHGASRAGYHARDLMETLHVPFMGMFFAQTGIEYSHASLSAEKLQQIEEIHSSGGFLFNRQNSTDALAEFKEERNQFYLDASMNTAFFILLPYAAPRVIQGWQKLRGRSPEKMISHLDNIGATGQEIPVMRAKPTASGRVTDSRRVFQNSFDPAQVDALADARISALKARKGEIRSQYSDSRVTQIKLMKDVERLIQQTERSRTQLKKMIEAETARARRTYQTLQTEFRDLGAAPGDLYTAVMNYSQARVAYQQSITAQIRGEISAELLATRRARFQQLDTSWNKISELMTRKLGMIDPTSPLRRLVMQTWITGPLGHHPKLTRSLLGMGMENRIHTPQSLFDAMEDAFRNPLSLFLEGRGAGVSEAALQPYLGKFSRLKLSRANTPEETAETLRLFYADLRKSIRRNPTLDSRSRQSIEDFVSRVETATTDIASSLTYQQRLANGMIRLPEGMTPSSAVDPTLKFDLVPASWQSNSRSIVRSDSVPEEITIQYRQWKPRSTANHYDVIDDTQYIVEKKARLLGVHLMDKGPRVALFRGRLEILRREVTVVSASSRPHQVRVDENLIDFLMRARSGRPGLPQPEPNAGFELLDIRRGGIR